MKYIVRKAYFDFEKEEKYLNEMSAKGLALTYYSWCRYVFEDAPQGEYVYRIELLENLINHPESQKYIKFMEETGAEFVASYMRWVYFRRKAKDGEFNIYSDLASKIKHYKRVRGLLLTLMFLNLYAWFMNFSLGCSSIVKGYTPINLYISFISLVIWVSILLFLIIPISKKINICKREKKIQE